MIKRTLMIIADPCYHHEDFANYCNAIRVIKLLEQMM
uniref:Uncharacterized protein n=1 Tax=Arundo donax TaxID=35708 RepID=A0A0A9A6A9_ARUDO